MTTNHATGPDPAPADATIRLLLADDHAVVRRGLAALVSTEPDMEVVAEAATASAAVERARIGDIDVVLMDLRFGGVDSAAPGGVEATRKIRSRPGAPAVLVVTAYDSDPEILGAIEAGAVGYMLKDAEPDVLLEAIRAAARGQAALAPAAQAALLGSVRGTRQSGPELSARELEVLRAIASGDTNRAVARRLGISEATVKTHLAHVFAKLDVPSRTAAVTTAQEMGLI